MMTIAPKIQIAKNRISERWHSCSPFFNRNYKIRRIKRTTAGTLKIIDTLSVSLCPNGVFLERLRNRILKSYQSVDLNRLPSSKELDSYINYLSRSPDIIFLDIDGTLALNENTGLLIAALLKSNIRLCIISHRDKEYIVQNIFSSSSSLNIDQNTLSKYKENIWIYPRGGMEKYRYDKSGGLERVEEYPVCTMTDLEAKAIEEDFVSGGILGERKIASYFLKLENKDPQKARALATTAKEQYGEKYKVYVFDDKTISISKTSKNLAVEEAFDSSKTLTGIYIGDCFDEFGNDRPVLEAQYGENKLVAINVGVKINPVEKNKFIQTDISSTEWLTVVLLHRIGEALGCHNNIRLAARFLNEQTSLLGRFTGLAYKDSYSPGKEQREFDGTQAGIIDSIFNIDPRPGYINFNRRYLFPEEEAIHMLPIIKKMKENGSLPVLLATGALRFSYPLSVWMEKLGINKKYRRIKIPRTHEGQARDIGNLVTCFLSEEEKKAHLSETGMKKLLEHPKLRGKDISKLNREDLIAFFLPLLLGDELLAYYELLSKAEYISQCISRDGSWELNINFLSSKNRFANGCLEQIASKLKDEYGEKPIKDKLGLKNIFEESQPLLKGYKGIIDGLDFPIIELLLDGTKISRQFLENNIIGIDDTCSRGESFLSFLLLMRMLGKKITFAVIEDGYSIRRGENSSGIDTVTGEYGLQIRPKQLRIRVLEDMPGYFDELRKRDEWISYTSYVQSDIGNISRQRAYRVKMNLSKKVKKFVCQHNIEIPEVLRLAGFSIRELFSAYLRQPVTDKPIEDEKQITFVELFCRRYSWKHQWPIRHEIDNGVKKLFSSLREREKLDEYKSTFADFRKCDYELKDFEEKRLVMQWLKDREKIKSEQEIFIDDLLCREGTLISQYFDDKISFEELLENLLSCIDIKN